MGTVLHMTVVAERVVPARLGTARSFVAAAGIVASAVGVLHCMVSASRLGRAFPPCCGLPLRCYWERR